MKITVKLFFFCLVLVNLPVYSSSLKWLHEFAIETELDEKEADLAVGTYGFRIVRKLDFIGNIYHIQHQTPCRETCGKQAEDLLELLNESPDIKAAEQQFELETEKKEIIQKLGSGDIVSPENRIIIEDLKKKFVNEDKEYHEKLLSRSMDTASVTFNDPGWEKQWQLNNVGQFSTATEGLDMNVMPLYKRGYRGHDVVVSVLDDGIDTKHPEFLNNYDQVASVDLNDPLNSNGNPRESTEYMSNSNSHGTKAAGEIGAEANNGVCGIGIAHKANIGGVRFLAGPTTDLLEAYALTFNPQYVQIYSNSWGPTDSGKLMKMAPKYSAKALEIGAKKGRDGKGSIYVFASGNGGYVNDNCGADPYVNSPYTFGITSVNLYGENARYDEHCAALSVAVPVGGMHSKLDVIDPLVITSDINKGCTDRFAGTSAATPLASGCFALLLEANPKLTYRDVQHLLPYATRLPNRHQQVWQKNGAGHLVSHFYGFGLLDCSQLIRQAQNWTMVGPQHNCTLEPKQNPIPIRSRYKVNISFKSDNCKNNSHNRVDRIEQVLVRLRFKHQRRGDLSIWLTSPAGTKSPLLLSRRKDSNSILTDFTFKTLMNWDENPEGVWLLEVSDIGRYGRTNALKSPGEHRGMILYASLTLLGTSGSTIHPKLPLGIPINQKAKILTLEEVSTTFNRQRMEFLTNMPLYKKTHTLLTYANEIDAIDSHIVDLMKDFLDDHEISSEDYKILLKSMKTKFPNF